MISLYFLGALFGSRELPIGHQKGEARVRGSRSKRDDPRELGMQPYTTEPGATTTSHIRLLAPDHEIKMQRGRGRERERSKSESHRRQPENLGLHCSTNQSLQPTPQLTPARLHFLLIPSVFSPPFPPDLHSRSEYVLLFPPHSAYFPAFCSSPFGLPAFDLIPKTSIRGPAL